MTTTKRRHEKARALYEACRGWPPMTPVTVKRANGLLLESVTESRAWLTPAGGAYVRVYGIPGNTRLDRVTLRTAQKGCG